MSSPTADRATRFADAVPAGLAAEDIRRRRAVHDKWRRHSTLIMALRRVLPGLCVLVILGMIGWAAVNTLVRGLGAIGAGSGISIRMLKPHFQGRDDKGQPYILSADVAVRDDNDLAKITLEGPVFTLGASGVQTNVRARHGVYHEDTRILDLTGDVNLDDSQGYHFVTEHALIDTSKNNVDGDLQIDGHGPLGQIAASSYAVRDSGAHVFFVGRVKTRIENHSAPAAAAKP